MIENEDESENEIDKFVPWQVKSRTMTITAALPKQGHFSRGVIRPVESTLLVQDIEKELASVGVVKARRYGLTTIVLDFCTGVLPTDVGLLNQRYRVTEYYDKPLQCYRCYEYGRRGVAVTYGVCGAATRDI